MPLSDILPSSVVLIRIFKSERASFDNFSFTLRLFESESATTGTPATSRTLITSSQRIPLNDPSSSSAKTSLATLSHLDLNIYFTLTVTAQSIFDKKTNKLPPLNGTGLQSEELDSTLI